MTGRRVSLPALLCAALVALPAIAPAAAFDAEQYCADEREVALLGLLNAYRVAEGREPLVLGATLGAAAEHHSAHMAGGGAFSHTMVEDGRSVTWLANVYAHGYPTRNARGLTPWVREVLYAGSADPARALAAWQRSDTHNAVLLGARAVAVGIGYVAGGRHGHYWTVVLGSVEDVDACAIVVDGGGAPPGGRRNLQVPEMCRVTPAPERSP